MAVDCRLAVPWVPEQVHVAEKDYGLRGDGAVEDEASVKA